MKIRLMLRPGGAALAARLAADAALAAALGARPNAAVGWLFPKFFDAQGPLLDRLLDLAAGEELSFLRDVEWSARELDAAPRLELLPRVTAGQTRAEAEHTLAAYKAEPLHATHGRWSVRRPSSIFLSRALGEDTLAHVDQWTGEFVLGSALAQALRASGLRGFELAPVLRLRQSPRSDAFHLVSAQAMPPAHFDATAWVDAGGTPRRYGSLVYAPAALEDAPDFARSAEPWGAWETPVWLVSPAVRRWADAAPWRGWRFRPVLALGSAAHAEYDERWRSVLDRLAAHGRASVPV